MSEQRGGLGLGCPYSATSGRAMCGPTQGCLFSASVINRSICAAGTVDRFRDLSAQIDGSWVRIRRGAGNTSRKPNGVRDQTRSDVSGPHGRPVRPALSHFRDRGVMRSRFHPSDVPPEGRRLCMAQMVDRAPDLPPNGRGQSSHRGRVVGADSSAVLGRISDPGEEVR